MRAIALAQAWRDAGGETRMLIAEAPAPVLDRIGAEGITVESIEAKPGSAADAEATGTAARHAAWLALDGYGFDAGFEAIARSFAGAGVRLLAVDDYGHQPHPEADAILDQNAGASPRSYPHRAPGCRLMLGPRHALLRSEFRNLVPREPTPGPGRRVLVTLGGSDPENVTSRVVAALARLDPESLEAAIVVGVANPHAASLEQALSRSSFPVRLLRGPRRMDDLMAWADLAIAGGGSTCWELARLGVPMIVLVLAENQEPVARVLAEDGTARVLGWGRDVPPEALADAMRSLLGNEEARLALSRKGQALVDGRGGERVVRNLLFGLRLVPVGEADCKLLFDWANDPLAREASFDSSPIPWETHRAWFARQLTDPDSRLFLGRNLRGDPVGQVRFELAGDEAKIGFSVAPEARSRGLAVELMGRGIEILDAENAIRRVHAYVRPGNAPILSVLRGVGFERLTATSVKGETAIHLCYESRP